MTVIDETAWRARVESELEGASFDKALRTRLREGLVVEPLYASAETLDAPFVRGTGVRTRGVARIDAASPQAGARLREALQGGAEGFWLELKDERALASAEALLGGIDRRADLCWALELHQPSLIKSILARIPTERTGVAWLDVAHTPLDALATALEHRQALGASARVLGVSTTREHLAGAHAVDELGWALALAADVLRGLEAKGQAIEAVLPAFAFRFAVGRDVFLEIAKLRAARGLWSRMQEALGVTAPAPMFVVAETSRRTLSQRDPAVNYLRVTTQVFAAMVAGADLVDAAAFDDALGSDAALGRRIARNTSLILEHEGHLTRTADPAGGSYYVESLTSALATAAWAELQRIERAGGAFAYAASGAAARVLEERSHQLQADIARRKLAITGVSEFPNPNEPAPSRGPAPSYPREAALFEALRDRVDRAGGGGAKPTVTLLTFGKLSEHAARLGFARGVFEIAGLGTITLGAEDRWEGPPPKLVCLAGNDAAYRGGAKDVATRLKRWGVQTVILAQRPGEDEAQLREAGVDLHLYLGADLAQILQQTLATLGVA
ncbi:MAG: methylmalonyl-CoA mutase family protein [Myxococcota bacterium]